MFFVTPLNHRSLSWSMLETFLKKKTFSEQKPDSTCKGGLSPFQQTKFSLYFWLGRNVWFNLFTELPGVLLIL